MKVLEQIKNELLKVWKVESNRRIIKDVSLLLVATVVFHFIYWNTNMDTWIFGPWTQTIYDFFRYLAFYGSKKMTLLLTGVPCDINDTSFYFYHINNLGLKVYDMSVEINIDCSGVKQILQFLLIILLCRGLWYKKVIYYIVGSAVILLFNIIRIILLNIFFVSHPQHFQLVHDWIARPMMYVIIFSLWLLWLNYCSKSFKHKKEII